MAVPRTAPVMNRIRSLLAIALSLRAVVGSDLRSAMAQEPPPDVRMLLDLDLFAAHTDGAQGAPAPANDSMMDQIRTLNAMGYLGNPQHISVNPAGGANPPDAEPKSRAVQDNTSFDSTVVE